jgi:outer membrane lipase/esterase
MFRLDRVWAPALAIAGVALLLAACGGGDQVEQFRAARVIAFGDENSVIVNDSASDDPNEVNSAGRKFTVNFAGPAASAPPLPPIDCRQHAIWVQTVAGHYGLTFPQCPGPVAPSTLASRIVAAPDTGVAEVGAQVDGFVAGGDGPFRSGDLATVFTGARDVHALGAQVGAGALSEDQAVAQVEQLGAEQAAAVNRIASLGARVLVSTIPDQGLTPQGRTGAAASATLSRLTQRFNARLRGRLVNDGRQIGLVLFDESVIGIVNTGTFNVATPACNDATLADVLGCTTQTLREGADLNTWLWADNLHIAPLGHATLGNLAVTRAANNPF